VNHDFEVTKTLDNKNRFRDMDIAQAAIESRMNLDH
jgi:hypothetical protein